MGKTPTPAGKPLMSSDAGLPVYGVSDPDYGLASGDDSPDAILGDAAIGVAGASGAMSAQNKLRGLLQGLSAGAGGLMAGKAMMPKDGEPDWPTILAALGGAGLGWVGSGKALDAVGFRKKNRENDENEKFGGVLEEKSADAALPQLLLAKMYSDRKHYLRKHAILRQLISKSPNDFVIDSEQPDGIVGLTHSPTQFRIHMPGQMLPTDVTVQRLQVDPIETLAGTAEPSLWENPDSRRALLASVVGQRGADYLMEAGPYAMAAAQKVPVPLPSARDEVNKTVGGTLAATDAARGVTDRLGITGTVTSAIDEAARKATHDQLKKQPPGGP